MLVPSQFLLSDTVLVIESVYKVSGHPERSAYSTQVSTNQSEKEDAVFLQQL